MRASFSTLAVFSVMIVLMLIALSNYAGAQTVTNPENGAKRAHVTAKVLTVVRSNGSVIQSTNGGQKWAEVDAETATKFTKDLQSKAGQQPVTPEAATASTALSTSPAHDARNSDLLCQAEKTR